MCCFNKVNLSAILLVHKRTINKDCTVKNNNEADLPYVHPSGNPEGKGLLCEREKVHMK